MEHTLLDWEAPFLAWMFVQIADVVTTRRALKRGGREANPIIAAMMDRLGDHGWIGAKLALSIVAAALIMQSGAPWMLWAVAGVTGAVAWRNLRQ